MRNPRDIRVTTQSEALHLAHAQNRPTSKSVVLPIVRRTITYGVLTLQSSRRDPVVPASRHPRRRRCHLNGCCRFGLWWGHPVVVRQRFAWSLGWRVRGRVVTGLRAQGARPPAYRWTHARQRRTSARFRSSRLFVHSSERRSRAS